MRVYLRPPQATDAVAFMAAARASRDLHGAWTSPPATRTRFAAYVARFAAAAAQGTHAGFLVLRREDDALVGVYNFSEIVHGLFQSTYLGYYGFAPHAGQGYMTEGMALALDVAFRKLRLHRVEVNIQPTNGRSLALAERVGFVREGYSRRYVKIAGRWRDHVRYAILAEEWRTLRGRHLPQRTPRP
jgi:[ribosomal protein S5]-alanine N-acetyltransferase